MSDLAKIGDMVKLELKRSTVVTPKNYSFENALKSAALIIWELTDRSKRPALEVCTHESVHNAILTMAVQGLNPGKNQCYFIVYGSQLQCIRSYMGAQMTAKLCVPKIADIRAQVVHEGEDIEIDVENGRDVIKRHKRSFSNISKADIIGTYAIAVDENENVLYCDIMNLDDIKASWKQSKMNAVAESGAINQTTTHGKFTGEMCKRTVINRLCKRIINTSDDTGLLSAFQQTDEDRPEPEIIQAEIREKANRIPLDFQAPEPKPTIPATPMATKDQAKQIMALENKEKDKVMENISGFLGRPVEKIRELTAAEAEDYIAALNPEPEESGGKPPWED